MINDNFFFIVNSTFQKTTFSYNKCPKCGNNIVLKKSFYGCSNYPECKFTLAEHFRKKKLTKTNVKELLEGKETLVKGIKNKEKKPYNAVVKIGEKGYIDFISFSK
jgi:DNA topoisomerase-3